MPLLTCSCGATCRIPSELKSRVRCGKCAHTFTPKELVKARPEPPPAKPDIKDLSDMFTGNQGEACADCGRPLDEDDYCSNCDEDDLDDADDLDEDDDED